uniref:C-type lectin domain-containing protein n=1 Tax=Stomoxys calcitrans TaxID=35570 RepID=A0A1I8NX15_STOCA
MSLIAVDSPEKSAALTQILRDNSVKVNLWLGGNDLGEEGRFVWASSGKKFAFSNWSKGNPDNHNNGDCINIWDVTDFEWNDAACNYTIGFICEEHPLLVAARKDLEVKKNFIEQVLAMH